MNYLFISEVKKIVSVSVTHLFVIIYELLFIAVINILLY